MTTTEQREKIADQLKAIAMRVEHGCGSDACQIKSPTGMRGRLTTSVPCRCRPGRIAIELLAISEELQEIVTWKDAGKPDKTFTLTP